MFPYPFVKNYTPDGNDEYTVLLLHFDGADGSGTFVDSSPRGHTVYKSGNPLITTAKSVFGGSCVKFDGVDDYLYLDGHNDFAFGTGDFTIDFWIWRGPNARIFADWRSGEGAFPCLATTTAAGIQYFVSSAARITSGGSTFLDTKFYHVAVTRQGTSTRLFLDGVQVGSTWTDTSNYGVGTNRPAIGAGPYVNSYDDGWIDEFRISKGIARWTSNFTPPTRPYS